MYIREIKAFQSLSSGMVRLTESDELLTAIFYSKDVT